MNISHIAIWVKDIENIKNFYVKYFNCKCNDKYINNKKGFESYFLSFENGSKIEIMNIKDINELKKIIFTVLLILQFRLEANIKSIV